MARHEVERSEAELIAVWWRQTCSEALNHCLIITTISNSSSWPAAASGASASESAGTCLGADSKTW
eukprot:22707-Chlamydomonas_euryale.AAC.12